MRVLKPILSLVLTGSGLTVFAQATTPAAQTPTPAAPQVLLPSAILQPSLTELQNTLNALKLDKWKKGSVRDEANENINAIQRDVQNNMPPLIATADLAPGSLSKTVPLMKHLDALYDVVLRVEEASRVVAPAEQVDALQQAMLKLSAARIVLDDQAAAQAAAQETQIADLQVALKAQEAIAQKVSSSATDGKPCKPAPAPAHKKRASKPAAKPSPSSPAGQQKTQ